MMGENRNYILAIALSLIILIGWQYFYAIPQMEKQKARERAAAAGAGHTDPDAADAGDQGGRAPYSPGRMAVFRFPARFPPPGSKPARR